MITDWQFYAMAVPAVMLMGLSKGGFSGVGMVSLPMLALVAPPFQVAAILLPILMVQDIFSVLALRRDFSGRNLKILMSGGLIGILLAMALARYVTDSQMLIVVGMIAAGFVLQSWIRHRGAEVPPSSGVPASGIFWGACAGFTSFVANAGAPPVQVFLTPQKLPPRQYAGTMSILFFYLNYTKFAAFIWLGQVNLPNLQVSFVLFPVAIVSVLMGVRLVKKVPAGLFYKLVNVMTFLVGLKLIWDGAAGMMR